VNHLTARSSFDTPTAELPAPRSVAATPRTETRKPVVKQRSNSPALLHVAIAGLFGAMAVSAAEAAPTDAQARAAWGAAMAHVRVPGDGCFKASYPSTVWAPVTCKAAPTRPYLPRHGLRSQTVGNGNDYAAVTATLTQSAIGSFPVTKKVTKETGYGGAKNTYSLQLNSDFMTTAGCSGSSNPSQCLTWEQFVYSSSETAAFMQYWLINYGSTCPRGGWMSYSGSCYKNSAAVSVPQLPITDLGKLSLSGAAVSGGKDTLVFTSPTDAYSTTGLDSVVDLATAWQGSEFNVIGDGGGSEAKFNKGASITVKIALDDGATVAPVCEADDGTTGETNNLKLGPCTVAGGASPSITFTEKN
jgi:hypothetical protein